MITVTSWESRAEADLQRVIEDHGKCRPRMPGEECKLCHSAGGSPCVNLFSGRLSDAPHWQPEEP